MGYQVRDTTIQLQQMVNALRECLGKEPLYGDATTSYAKEAREHNRSPQGKRLRKLAYQRAKQRALQQRTTHEQQR